MNSHNKHIVVFTAIESGWGGSEELWYEAVLCLRKEGYRITVIKKAIDAHHPRIIKLQQHGIQFKSLKVRAFSKIHAFCIRFFPNTYHRFFPPFTPTRYHELQLASTFFKQLKPDLILFNQGMNFDGLLFAQLAAKMEIPYMTLSQKAVDFFWPMHNELEAFRIALSQSLENCFVSKHNIDLTTRQMSMPIPHASLVYNPILKRDFPVLYPNNPKFFHLICVGRLHLLDKGQDLLLQVLSSDEWKSRPLKVTFVGSGPDEHVLKQLTSFYGLTNINFESYRSHDLMWHDAHGLILPSRSEGLPLVVLEAMAAGRMVITTYAGGSAEWINEDRGFISQSNVHDLNSILEQAWQHRDAWQQMGLNAYHYFMNHYPNNAALLLSNKIKQHLHVSTR